MDNILPENSRGFRETYPFIIKALFAMFSLKHEAFNMQYHGDIVQLSD